jgi:hypothetical protein
MIAGSTVGDQRLGSVEDRLAMMRLESGPAIRDSSTSSVH